MVNEKACLYFCDEQCFEGVLLLGTMELLVDEKDKEEFWKEEYRIYYSKGEGMEDFTVLKFCVLDGEAYKDFKVKNLFQGE